MTTIVTTITRISITVAVANTATNYSTTTEATVVTLLCYTSAASPPTTD